MGIVLDTSILIAAERGAVQLEKLLRAHAAEPISVCAVTAAELLHGCFRAREAGVRARRSAFVESLLELLPVLPYGMREARRHAELWAELAVQGRLIGPHDMIIAATALAGGHALATLNQAELSRVPGLRLIPL